MDLEAAALLTGALLAGGLLTVRTRPAEGATSLAFVPLVVMQARFGWSALGAMTLVGLAVGLLVRRLPLQALLFGLAVDAFAFALAASAASLAGSQHVLEAAVFGLTYLFTWTGVWVLIRRTRWERLASWQGEPRPVLLLALIPLALVPVAASERLGDGALLLALAGLLALMAVVREASNLGVARVEAERERDRLQRAVELQDELVHLMTHELKNPLTAVRAYTQLAVRVLHSGGDAAKAEDYLGYVEGGGRAMERLVENLLQLSRLEQSGELPPAEPIVLTELAGLVLEDLGPLAERKGQTVRIEVPEDAPAAFAPSVLLREAVSNLVSNAIKYTPEGGCITITGGGCDGGSAVLEVVDNGIGMSQEDLDQLFSKFFRGSDPRAREERGTGLGLALTHAIIQRMGGRIEVQSAPDRGTTFRIIVPTVPVGG